MRYLKICLLIISCSAIMSCGETKKQDNTTGSADTMVIKEDRTDSATNSISTDTTQR